MSSVIAVQSCEVIRFNHTIDVLWFFSLQWSHVAFFQSKELPLIIYIVWSNGCLIWGEMYFAVFGFAEVLHLSLNWIQISTNKSKY